MSVSFLFQTKTVFFTRQRTYRLLSPLVILTFIPYLCQEKPASRCLAVCILGIYLHSGASFSNHQPGDSCVCQMIEGTRFQSCYTLSVLQGRIPLWPWQFPEDALFSEETQIFYVNRQMTYVLQSLNQLQLKSTQIDWQLTT